MGDILVASRRNTWRVKFENGHKRLRWVSGLYSIEAIIRGVCGTSQVLRTSRQDS